MKKVKNCTKLVPFFARDGRLRSKWTLSTLSGHYFKNTHSRHYVPLNPLLDLMCRCISIRESILLNHYSRLSVCFKYTFWDTLLSLYTFCDVSASVGWKLVSAPPPASKSGYRMILSLL